MVGRAEEVTEGAIKGLVVAGAVEPSGRAAVAIVVTAEVPRARGCGTGVQSKSQDWPKLEAAEQRRRQKSRNEPEPEAAVQRERHEPRNGAEPAVGQRARRGRRRGRARPSRGLRR